MSYGIALFQYAFTEVVWFMAFVDGGNEATEGPGRDAESLDGGNEPTEGPGRDVEPQDGGNGATEGPGRDAEPLDGGNEPTEGLDPNEHIRTC